MSPDLRKYLEELIAYCKHVTILGDDVHYCDHNPGLDCLFVEPEAEAGEEHDKRPQLVSWDAPSANNPVEALGKTSAPPEPVLSVVARTPRMILKGDPGMGKTTTLRYIAVKKAREWRAAVEAGDEPGAFPILVELVNWRVPSPDELESSCEEALRQALPRPVAKATSDAAWLEIAKLYEAGECCLLLDGLDEYTGNPSDITETIVSSTNPAKSLIVSSRPMGTAGWGMPIYFLRELEPAAVATLCERLCPEKSARGRLRAFATGAGAPICRIPLFLSMASRLAAESDDMPRTRGGMFDSFFGWMERWEKDKLDGWEPTVTHRIMREALGPLALTLRLGEISSLNADNIETAFCEVTKTPINEVFDYLQRQSILAPDAHSRQWRFCDEVVLDYFAARGLADSERPFDHVQGKLHWPRLTWVIPMAVGMMDTGKWSRWKCFWDFLIPKRPRPRTVSAGLNAGPVQAGISETTPPDPEAVAWRRTREYFLQRVLKANSPYERELMRDLTLALRCVGECDCLDARLCKHMIGKTTLLMPPKFTWLGMALGDVAVCPSARDHLLKRTQDTEMSVREAAIEALRSVAEDPAVQERLTLMSRNSEDPVSWSAAEVLEDMSEEHEIQTAEDPEVRAHLIEQIENPDGVVRGISALFLDEIAWEPDIKKRLLAMTNDPHPSARLGATWTLRSVARAPEVQECLLKLTHRCDVLERAAAVLALRDVVDNSAVQKRLLELLSDKNGYVRWVVQEALASVAGEPAVQEHLLKLTRDENDGVRRNAIEALASVAEETAVQTRLLKLTRDENDGVRRNAIEALASVAEETEVQARLVELYENTDEDRKVRQIVIFGLRATPWAVDNCEKMLGMLKRDGCRQDLYDFIQRLEREAQENRQTLRAYLASSST